jgi:hypothetical protein
VEQEFRHGFEYGARVENRVDLHLHAKLMESKYQQQEIQKQQVKGNKN